MKYKINKEDGTRNIYAEDGENERDVLRAIVIASFETASPVGMEWLHFQNDQKMTNKDANHFITLPPKYADIVVDMDYVQGRKCKTVIRRKNKEHFVLDDRLFMRDRDVPESVL